MRVSFATEPGSSSRANEDFIAATPSAVVLLDGAGVPEGLDTGCLHGVRWFVVELGTRLLAQLVTRTSESLADALARAIGDVRALHKGRCDLDHPGTPAAAVALLRDRGDQLEYLVLADCTVVLETREGIQAITDDRISQVARAERARRDAKAGGSAEHEHGQSRLVTAQRSHRNRQGGYWVASSDPSAAYEAIAGTVASQHLGRALLMTDGATRLVDTFALATWHNVLGMLEDEGPEGLVIRVRDAERADPQGLRWPRGKRHDDATVALCHFG
jgi:Protein phosphatase 2C